MSGNGTQYTCDCTSVDVVLAVGQYCDTTISGKPVSATADNCPDCESLFVCDNAYDGSDPEAYTDGVILKLAAAFCDCNTPRQTLVNVFGAVQHKVQDEALCMEFTIYSGNPNASATDIVKDLQDKPPKNFIVVESRPAALKECTDEVNGCNKSSSDNTLLWILIGAGSFCFLFILLIVWYHLHKRVAKQFKTQDSEEGGVKKDATDTKEPTETVTVHTDTKEAHAHTPYVPSGGDDSDGVTEITVPVDDKTVLPTLDDLNDQPNQVNVPAQAAAAEEEEF
jgi:hypothetical protein